jgi:hypothetical protein
LMISTASWCREKTMRGIALVSVMSPGAVPLLVVPDREAPGS